MTTMSAPELTVLLEPEQLRADLLRDARAGLTASHKSIPPKYHYDAAGSELFDRITRLEEYYPTRAERSALHEHALDIATEADAQVLLELGSGSSEKSQVLLDAMARAGTLTGYVPVDVSADALRGAIDRLRRAYPSIRLHGAVADFTHQLAQLPAPEHRMIAFLGSTIGNFPPAERATFLARVAAVMRQGEWFLLGVDLVKDPARLVAAYNDAAGVTARFNRNVLRVLNRELDADFPADRFTHVATWDAANEWMRLRLRADEAMQVRIRALDLRLQLHAGEDIDTEISAKFRRDGVAGELAAAGLTMTGWFTDPAGDYALALARR